MDYSFLQISTGLGAILMLWALFTDYTEEHVSGHEPFIIAFVILPALGLLALLLTFIVPVVLFLVAATAIIAAVYGAVKLLRMLPIRTMVNRIFHKKTSTTTISTKEKVLQQKNYRIRNFLHSSFVGKILTKPAQDKKVVKKNAHNDTVVSRSIRNNEQNSTNNTSTKTVQHTTDRSSASYIFRNTKEKSVHETEAEMTKVLHKRQAERKSYTNVQHVKNVDTKNNDAHSYVDKKHALHYRLMPNTAGLKSSNVKKTATTLLPLINSSRRLQSLVTEIHFTPLQQDSAWQDTPEYLLYP